jgi:TPR repeat protein
LKTAADAGDPDAQLNLGYLYARGQGVAQNQQEAMRLYLLSAKQGNPEGMNAVGFKYRYGMAWRSICPAPFTGSAGRPVRVIRAG